MGESCFLVPRLWKFRIATSISKRCCGNFADVFSLNGFESEAAVSTSLSKDIHSGGGNSNTPFNLSTDQNHRSQKSSEQSKGSLEHGVKPFGGHDDISSLSMDETSSRGEGGILNNCGILPSNCLPCLASTAPITEKKRPLSSSPTNSIKMPSLKLPFKKKAGEGHASATPCECLKCLLFSVHLCSAQA